MPFQSPTHPNYIPWIMNLMADFKLQNFPEYQNLKHLLIVIIEIIIIIIIISLTSIFFQDKSRVWTAASQQH